jgi:purine-binding chemotaxis protein CheW
VQGVAIIRGIPTPVIDLGAVLSTPNDLAERFVTVRAGDKQVAVSVNAVLGVCDLDTIMIHELPPLLQGAAKEIVEMIGTLDEQVLMILRAGWELPDEVWRVLPPQEMAS